MYTTINEELRIQSCSIEDLSQKEKDQFEKLFQGDSVTTLTAFYNLDTDTVVLNHDNTDFDFYLLLAETFLTENLKTRERLLEQVPESCKETTKLLNEIANRRDRIKRKQEADEEARKIRKIIGNQTYELYMKHFDILEAFHRVDHHHKGFLRDFNPFMYGYILGIRAERARRRRVPHE